MKQCCFKLKVECCNGCPTKACNNERVYEDEAVRDQLMVTLHDRQTTRHLLSHHEVRNDECIHTLSATRLVELIKCEEVAEKYSTREQATAHAAKTAYKRNEHANKDKNDDNCSLCKASGHQAWKCEKKCRVKCCNEGDTLHRWLHGKCRPRYDRKPAKNNAISSNQRDTSEDSADSSSSDEVTSRAPKKRAGKVNSIQATVAKVARNGHHLLDNQGKLVRASAVNMPKAEVKVTISHDAYRQIDLDIPAATGRQWWRQWRPPTRAQRCALWARSCTSSCGRARRRCSTWTSP